MSLFSFSKEKFLSLPLKRQHKKAATCLRLLYMQDNLEKHPLAEEYRLYEKWLHLPPTSWDQKALADRYHTHLHVGQISLKEHHLLPHVKRGDRKSTAPFLPIAIYLDHLRCAHNIGSIMRTVEAFRLGTLYFSEKTPFKDHQKIDKTAMGTSSLVPCSRLSQLSDLPRPFIGLETVENAPYFFDFIFPSTFSLLIGNEEYGLSNTSLKQTDALIQIPLQGSKNSLNVACAFAIIAAEIRRQIHQQELNQKKSSEDSRQGTLSKLSFQSEGIV